MWTNSCNNRRRHFCLSFLYHLTPISISTVIHPGASGMVPFLSTLEMKYRSFHCQRRANKSFRDFWLDWLSDTGLFELTFCGGKPDTTTPLFTTSSGCFGCHFLFGPAALVLLPSAAIGWRDRWQQVYRTQQVPYIFNVSRVMTTFSALVALQKISLSLTKSENKPSGQPLTGQRGPALESVVELGSCFSL